jgi:hypothetical protein
MTIALISVVAVGLSFLPLAWTPVNFALGTAVVVLVMFLGWWLRRLSSAYSPHLRIMNLNPVSLLVGLLAASGAVIAMMLVLFSSPDYFVQTDANIFHLNAVRYSLDSGQASTFAIGQLNAGGAINPIYPAAWNDYVTLVIRTAQYLNPAVSIAAAANAATISVLILCWSLGCLVLAQVVGGRSITQSLLAAVASSSIYLFPWLPFAAEGRYQLLLAYSMLISAFAVILLLPRLRSDSPPLRALSRFSRAGRQPRPNPSGKVIPQRVQPPEDPETVHLFGAHSRTILVLVAISYLIGLVAGHLSAAFGLAFAALLACWGIFFSRVFRRTTWVFVLARVLAAVTLAAATAAFGYVWMIIAAATTSPEVALTGVVPQLLNLALATPAGVIGTTAFTALLAISVAAAIWQRRFVVLALWLAASASYVLAIGGPSPEIARMVGAIFDRDPSELAAFWLVATVPLLLTGTGGIVKLFTLVTAKLGQGSRRLIAVAVAAVAAVAIGLPQQLVSVQPQLSADRQRLIVPSAAAAYVSADEFALMSRLATIVPAGNRLIGDPGNGSAFAYALSGVPVVFSHLSFTESSAATQLRNSMFDRAQLPSTCTAIQQLHAYYFADFGAAPDADQYPGLAKVDASMLELVTRQGDATIYRFTACGS